MIMGIKFDKIASKLGFKNMTLFDKMITCYRCKNKNLWILIFGWHKNRRTIKLNSILNFPAIWYDIISFDIIPSTYDTHIQVPCCLGISVFRLRNLMRVLLCTCTELHTFTASCFYGRSFQLDHS